MTAKSVLQGFNSTTVCLRCAVRLLSHSFGNSPLPWNLKNLPIRGTASKSKASSSRASGEPSHGSSRTGANSLASHTLTRTLSTVPEATNELASEHIPPEDAARAARQMFGERLPEGYLSSQAYNVYERLYGPPLPGNWDELEEITDGLGTQEEVGNSLQQRGGDGAWAEVQTIKPFQTIGDTEPAILAPEEEFDGEEESTEIEEEGVEAEDAQDSDYMRAHPLTVLGRFETSPSTLQLPKSAFTEPIAELLGDLSKKHLSEAAERTFGGPGLPYSTATPSSKRSLEQKAIPLQAGQGHMTEMEADLFIASLMPGLYASAMSTIVEVRKRLGSGWLESLFQRADGPRILDTGAGGAGVVAWREVLKAEWARTHGDMAEVAPVLYGKATVITGSAPLRYRASRFLENTTFLPRIPDYVHATDAGNSQGRKQYDLIIASHTLWPLREEYHRKEHVQKLWSLLDPNGGVLILVEKGLPRGFETIGGARNMLLKRYLSPSDTAPQLQPLFGPAASSNETGMIIAPCTNHEQCPMYTVSGVSRGRKDFCHFSQRYIRPSYYQSILNARARNHEDVRFSYLAIQRGRDQRKSEGLRQGPEAADAAFSGFESQTTDAEAPLESSTPAINTLSLPRAILPPLKRRGHVTIDVCTPAGQIERWTVPRSFSKLAYRDARKSQWGDLWALGAKSRSKRNLKLGEKERDVARDGKGKKPRNNAAMV